MMNEDTVYTHYTHYSKDDVTVAAYSVILMLQYML